MVGPSRACVLLLGALVGLAVACGRGEVEMNGAVPSEIRGERIDAPVGTPADAAGPANPAAKEFEIPFAADEPLAAVTPEDLALAADDLVIVESTLEAEAEAEAEAEPDTEADTDTDTEAEPAAEPDDPVFVSFEDLAVPDYDPVTLWNKPAEERPPYEYPAEIAALDGKRITIDGFVIPTKAWGGELREFALSMDPPGCCFGQSTAIDKWIEVELKPDIPAVEYSAYGIVTVTGTLTVAEKYSDYGYVESLYQLVADHAELSW